MTERQWTADRVRELFEMPFFALVQKAYAVHQENFKDSEVEFCKLLNIKTGGCPENCKYCPQSAHYNTGLEREQLFDVERVLNEAKAAKAQGAKRFCMGAAWRSPPKADFPKVLELVEAVKNEGLETCMTLGMLDAAQAEALKASGLDYYNHNIDTSETFYDEIISTRDFQERIDTLNHVIDADIHVCCGGIMGMGETREDRIQMLLTLSKLRKPPASIPINKLIPVPGTPLEDRPAIDPFEYIRMIAVTRILFPTSKVRLSAGRLQMSDEMQAWCFMAGANSIFVGDKLLVTENPDQVHDTELLSRLDLQPESVAV